MTLERGNIFDNIPAELGDELVERLALGEGARVERIVSRGHASDEGSWYDQDEDEWVVLLAGSAVIRFDGDAGEVRLRPGDHVDIPAHARHRVEWTEPGADTVWLAVFYRRQTEGD